MHLNFERRTWIVDCQESNLSQNCESWHSIFIIWLQTYLTRLRSNWICRTSRTKLSKKSVPNRKSGTQEEEVPKNTTYKSSKMRKRKHCDLCESSACVRNLNLWVQILRYRWDFGILLGQFLSLFNTFSTFKSLWKLQFFQIFVTWLHRCTPAWARS